MNNTMQATHVKCLKNAVKVSSTWLYWCLASQSTLKCVLFMLWIGNFCSNFNWAFLYWFCIIVSRISISLQRFQFFCTHLGKNWWMIKATIHLVIFVMHLSMWSPRGGGQATHGNLTVMYIPRVGILIGHHAFDLSISNRRREVSHLFLFAWEWAFDNFSWKMSKSPLYARPPSPWARQW